jgi:hypothetical protein
VGGAVVKNGTQPVNHEGLHGGCGCQYGGRCCLECPLETCIHDSDDPRRHTWIERRQETARLRKLGFAPPQVAERLGISVRSVHRRAEAENAQRSADVSG